MHKTETPEDVQAQQYGPQDPPVAVASASGGSVVVMSTTLTGSTTMVQGTVAGVSGVVVPPGGMVVLPPGMAVLAGASPPQAQVGWNVEDFGVLASLLAADKLALQAVCRGNTQLLRDMHGKGLPLGEYVYWRDASLLHVAAALGQQEAISLLVGEVGMKVDGVSLNGATPAMWAVENGQDGALNLLVSLGANVNAVDVFGKTVVNRAVDAGFNNTAQIVRRVGGLSSRSLARSAMAPTTPKAGGGAPPSGPSDLEANAPSPTPPQTGMPPPPVLNQARSHDLPEAVAAEDPDTIAPVGLCGSLMISPQRMGIILSAFTIIWLVLSVVCLGGPEIGSTYYRNSCPKIGIMTVAGQAVLGVAYGLYLIEALFCKAAIYLYNIRSAERGFITYLSGVNYRPAVVFKVECYHNEERGSGKDRHTVRVVTHRAETTFMFDDWLDIDDDYPKFDSMCRVDLERSFILADAYTEACFEGEKNAFIASNQYDVHQSFSQQVDLPSAEDHIAIDQARAPCLMRYRWYFLCTLVLMSVPFRIWMNSVTAKRRVDMRKLLYRRPVAGTGGYMTVV